MIVIVVGMHRSGTSALAGLLHRHGVMMGEPRTFRPRPSPENPFGYYENLWFRKLNDRILAESGYHVKSWNPAIPDIRAKPITRFLARTLVSYYRRRYEVWGWKDPRTCLTLPAWLDVLDGLNRLGEVRAIHISRNVASVAQSMVRRGNSTFEVAFHLWAMYNQRAMRALEQRAVPSLFLTYEDLCQHTSATTDRLFHFLGVSNRPDPHDTFIDRRLDRSSSPSNPPAISPATQRVADLVASALDSRRLSRPSS